MGMNHVYLIRHGENVANLTLEFSYRKVDYSLTPKGVLQAQQTADWFRNKKIDAVYASPLKRAYETAQIIAAPHSLSVTPVEAFREVNVGDLEGQKPTAELWNLHNAIVLGWLNGKKDVCFPGGENYFTLLDRVRNGLIDILTGKEDQNIVVVAHGGIFTFPMCDLCGADVSIFSTIMSNCAITELEACVDGNGLKARLVRFAANDHLTGDAARLVSGIPDEANPIK